MKENSYRTLTELLEFNLNRLDGVNDSPRFTENMEFLLFKDDIKKIYIFNIERCRGLEVVLRSKYKLEDDDILFKNEKEIVLKSINDKHVKFRINKVNNRRAYLFAICVLANYFPNLQTIQQKEPEQPQHIHDEHCNHNHEQENCQDKPHFL